MSQDKDPNTHQHQKAVFYTDGSARPTNPGYAGWAVHGYTYNPDPIKKGAGHAKVQPTEKGYQPKQTQEGYLDVSNYYDFVGWSKYVMSNNGAEIKGFSQALNYIASQPQLKQATIYSDSRYVIDGVTKHLANWVVNDFVKKDGDTVANVQEWKELLKHLKTVNDNGCELKIEWVKGHSDNFGNHIADHHASIGSHSAESKQEDGSIERITPAQGYWKNEAKAHPMIAHRGVLFVSNPEKVHPGEYYQCSQIKSDEFIGRGEVSAGFGYCKIQEPDPLVELVRSRQLELTRSFETLFLLRRDRVYDKSVSASLEMFGKDVLAQKHHLRQDLYFVNESLMSEFRRSSPGEQTKLLPVVEELFPPMLAYRAANACSKLQALCETIQALYQKDPDLGKNQPGLFRGPKDHLVFDVTHEFFDEVKDKKGSHWEFKKSISVSTQSVDIHREAFGKERRFQLLFRIHLMGRNSLKSLENTDVRVWLIVMKDSDHAFRYFTVVKSDQDWSAWMARDSNLLIDKKP